MPQSATTTENAWKLEHSVGIDQNTGETTTMATMNIPLANPTVPAKSALMAAAITHGLGATFVDDMLEAGQTLSEIHGLIRDAGNATKPEAKKPEPKPALVQPEMPVQRTGEKGEDFVKRVVQYGQDIKAYALAVAAGRRKAPEVKTNDKGLIILANCPGNGTVWGTVESWDAIIAAVPEVQKLLATDRTRLIAKRDAYKLTEEYTASKTSAYAKRK